MSLLTPVWVEAGPPNAKTSMVFLHGIGGGKKGFQSSVDFFGKQGFRALAWDMPGYGNSPLDGTLSFESLAASLETMLDAAKS
jgi:3-oxoadipate enol-lactonase